MAVTSSTEAHRVDVTIQSRRERAYLKEREEQRERAEIARIQRSVEELALIGTRVNIEA